MTVYCYDTEFLEDGTTIDLISIGIVCADGREYYAVNADCDFVAIRDHDWLWENVVPHLPTTVPSRFPLKGRHVTVLDLKAAAVKPKWVIANEVRAFIVDHITPIGENEGKPIYVSEDIPELWAYYGAYDHVALSQLWGPMINHPHLMPMFTHELVQEMERVGVEADIVPKPKDLHNALADARWNMAVLSEIRHQAASRG
ncbi:3'-5' exoribonuclease [Mycolicibacterium canariasense]|uniref:3'-5' exoribonuclease n=1 Tax=Mycolicibacterium canariasense TaxID=228230 RepID=UPI000A163EF1|nr:3'-5' exoribonuclease [Mycolicibacterium canariasense]MCV7208350.1 3'-5' exoribonuclease [Mycolicibacterium canariasense]ORV13538.1 hypothetical protein AWB94_04770 [Mycolicibacterium canariasense]